MKYSILAFATLFASPLLATPVEVESGKAIAMIPQISQNDHLQRRNCPAGSGLCPSGGCCPTGGDCCRNGSCCNKGYRCWISHLGEPGCCPNGIVCKCIKYSYLLYHGSRLLDLDVLTFSSRFLGGRGVTKNLKTLHLLVLTRVLCVALKYIINVQGKRCNLPSSLSWIPH